MEKPNKTKIFLATVLAMNAILPDVLRPVIDVSTIDHKTQEKEIIKQRRRQQYKKH